jgi:hypothetical protein
VGYAGLQPEDPHEIGPYRLLGQLGSGGLGQVFLGMSTGGRPIAVKVIRPELADDPGFRAQLRLEVAAAQRVNGLYTALVVDADLDGPSPWLATAYVYGPSLADVVNEHGPLPVDTVASLAAGLAEGLIAIHAAGVVHRDLKPSNVLLSKDGPRVIDFGISQAAEAAMPTGGDVTIGSPGYMSPEQIVGAEVGPPSDIFSLGAVLTFAATGEGPFGSGSRSELLDRIAKLPPDLGSVPSALRPLVKMCLAKDPRRRPAAQDLLDRVGAMAPEPGWIADSVFTGFTAGDDTIGFSALAVPSVSADASADAGGLLAPPASELTLPGIAKRPARRRSRSLIPACVSGALVVASAVAVLALTKPGSTPVAAQGQPRATAAAAAAAANALVAEPVITPGAGSPAKATATAKAKATPSVFVTPAGNQAIVPSVASVLPATSSAVKASPKPTKSAVKTASPTPTKSVIATPTPTPTPTVSTTPTPTPTPTPTVTVSSAPPSTTPSTTAAAPVASVTSPSSGTSSSG